MALENNNNNNNNNNNIHPFPFMQLQNPTRVGTLVSSPSRNLQDSKLDWLNRGESSTSGVQGLAYHMEALNLSMSSNPYGFHDYYGTNHLIMHEAALDRMRTVDAVNQVQQHHHHHNMGRYLGSPSCEQLVSLAKDSRGSRLLQRKIEQATPQEIYVIFQELKGHLHELMKHPFGHSVVLKFFQSSSISINNVKVIIFLIVKDLQKFKDVCMDDLGNRVVQKMLENVIEKIPEDENPNMIHLITDSLKLIVVPLMKNFNGGFVIQQYLKLFPLANKNVILDVAAKNFIDIARDRSGCCIIQKCMELAEVQAFWQLVKKIISNAVLLAEDAYGNYVVQFLVKQKILAINQLLVSRLRNKYVELSMDKYASNVVEVLLQCSETEIAAIIVHELMDSPEFFNVLLHPFGNYVVQRALRCTKGSLHANLYNIVLSNYGNLNSCLHGKMVLASAKACKARRLENARRKLI